MGKYIHLFETEQQFQDKRNNDYLEPWVSLTEDIERIDYNKTEREKLLGTPLTFEIQSNGEIRWKANSTGATKTIEYSKNGGEWTSITSSTGGTSISVVSGDTIQFRGNNSTYGTEDYNCFSNTTCSFSAKGNIMSLINSTDFATLTTLESAYTFYCMFSDCTGLTDASKLLLPATTLAYSCYEYMFAGCTSLVTAPELPATTLAENCYDTMFYNCTSLTTAPALPATALAYDCYDAMFSDCTGLVNAPALPATTLAENCYYEMFDGCTSLTTAPALPATTLTDRCYYHMFRNCSSLTTAPALPATTLATGCYSAMFAACSSLTVAPALPATTLATDCYNLMFYNCSNLNYIKCLATDISATNCTYNWVSGVAASGTFVKAASMSSWTTGIKGIPDNWTVQDAS